MTGRGEHGASANAGLRTLDDGLLLRRSGHGDAAAFGVLYERHAGPAYALARRLSGEAAAEDVVQEAFLDLWRSAARFDPRRGRVRTYLLTIVHNRAIDSHRRTGPDERLREEGDPELRLEAAERTDLQVARRLDAEALRRALRRLPPAQAQIVALAFYVELTHQEIAATLGLPLGTVKGRVRLALARLADQLPAPVAG